MAHLSKSQFLKKPNPKLNKLWSFDVWNKGCLSSSALVKNGQTSKTHTDQYCLELLSKIVSDSYHTWKSAPKYVSIILNVC